MQLLEDKALDVGHITLPCKAKKAVTALLKSE